jgi:hypothetical protein
LSSGTFEEGSKSRKKFKEIRCRAAFLADGLHGRRFGLPEMKMMSKLSKFIPQSFLR